MKLCWLSPGRPDQRTGGYLWNARIVSALGALGAQVEVIAVQGAWPTPGLTDPGPVDAIPPQTPVIADGLLWPGLGEAGSRLAARCPVSVVVHSLLSQETGLDPALALALDRAEREALAGVRLRVATSALTASALGPALPAEIVIPGTDPALPSTGSDGRTVLTVGTLTRRKGHERILDALRSVEGDWRLRCAGGARDPAWAESLRARTEALGLSDRVSWLGELDDAEMAAEYARADLVVHAARYESFGMAVAEAVARGLPVVSTPAGVLDHLPPETVLSVDGGEREVIAGLAEAIAGLLADPEARRRAAARSAAAARGLPSWEDQARRLAALLATSFGTPGAGS